MKECQTLKHRNNFETRRFPVIPESEISRRTRNQAPRSELFWYHRLLMKYEEYLNQSSISCLANEEIDVFEVRLGGMTRVKRDFSETRSNRIQSLCSTLYILLTKKFCINIRKIVDIRKKRFYDRKKKFRI
jgi:hypothetical protein